MNRWLARLSTWRTKQITHRPLILVVWCALVTDNVRLSSRLNGVQQLSHISRQLNVSQQLSVDCVVLTEDRRRRWRHQQSTWRQWQRPAFERIVVFNWQPLDRRVIVRWHTPDTVLVVLGDVQLSIMSTSCNVSGGMFHSFNVNIIIEWTQCVGAVSSDDGGLTADNVDDVTKPCYSTHLAYNVTVIQPHTQRHYI